MRPIELVMSAFGPYVKETRLDFSELKGRHFFLICGPTGSGKTTILDAMCYALYGVTSGSLRSGETMRSDYADEKRKTFVRFTFAVGDKRYRIERSPKQELQVTNKRSRNYGTKQESGPEATFCEVDEKGQEVRALASKTKDVTEAATKLLGFAAAQFRQVVLLPQGDFRKLLVADSKDRQDIMKQLFGTERFQKVEKKLKERLTKMNAASSEMTSRLSALYGRYGVTTAEELAAEREALQKKEEDARREQAAAAAAFETVQKSYDAARSLASLYQTLDEAEKEEKKLAGQKDVMAEKEKELDKIERADKLAARWQEVDRISAMGVKQKDNLAAFQKEKEELEKENLRLEGAWEQSRKEEPLQEMRQKEILRLAQMAGDAVLYETARRNAARLEKALKEAGRKSDRLQQAAAAADKARHEKTVIAATLRETYMRGQAAVLAGHLEEGTPCPVCGALHHPRPAVSKEALPTEGEVKKAEAAQKEGEDAWRRAAAEERTFQEKTLSPLVQQEAAARGQKEELRRRLPQDFESEESLQKKRTALEKEEAAWKKARENLERDRQRNMTDLARAEQALISGKKEIETLRARYREANQALEEEAKQQGFTDKADASIWKGRIGEVPLLKANLDQYRAALARTAQTKEKMVTSISGKPRPDMARFEGERKEALTRKSDAEAAQAVAQKAVSDIKADGDRIAAMEKEQEKTRQLLSLVQELSDVVSGVLTGVNLERFVLGALLDEVTEAANLRLARMSRRRYMLRRADKAADNRKKVQGLDLEVFDNYTGYARPASTLSGGETFLASLSLALGLADVVQSYAGGIHLDTMFIDEGFGTLDEETLDTAVSTLMELQQGGRLVGIISHVPELAERIDAKLRITAAREGSTAAFEVE